MGWIKRQKLLGLMFSLFVLGCMKVKIPVFQGLFVDQRNAVVIMAGTFGGPLAALIAAATGGVYRAVLGGQGVAAGVFGLSLSFAAGSFLHARRAGSDAAWKTALASVAASIFVLSGFILVGSPEEGWALAKRMPRPYCSAISKGIFIGGVPIPRRGSR